MIIFFRVNLKILFKKGRNYPWKKPGKCFQCHSNRLWGHGFVSVFFDEFKKALFVKRYRCPDCGTVFRIRPIGYFSRFQASIDTIRSSIALKAGKRERLRGISRTRQQHWYRALLRHIAAYFGDTWEAGMASAFDALISLGVTPVTRGYINRHEIKV